MNNFLKEFKDRGYYYQCTNELELSKYNRIICLDELEHKPMVQSNHKLRDMNIEYWNIVDEPKVSSDVSLPQCYKRVKNLVSQLSVELS